MIKILDLKTTFKEELSPTALIRKINVPDQSEFVDHPGKAFHTARIKTLDWQMIPQNWTSLGCGILFGI